MSFFENTRKIDDKDDEQRPLQAIAMGVLEYLCKSGR